MKGLIKKDYITLTKKIPLVNRFIIVIVIISVLISLKSAGVVALSIFLPLMAVSFPTTLINDDDKFKWDKYVLALPVTKQKIVASRYIFCILLLFCSYIFNIIIGTIIFLLFHEYSISQLFIVAYIGVALGMIYLFLLLPCLYKFGSNGGHVVMIVLAIISSIVAVIKKGENFSLQQILELPIMPCIIISIVAICIMEFISYLISLKLYEYIHS